MVLKKEYLEKELDFKKIGEYCLVNNELERSYKEFTKELISKEWKLVYAFIVDDLVMYIGKTKQGLCRPLSYHRDYNNNNNKTRGVHKGIREVVKNNKIIEDFARVFKPIQFEKLDINPYVGVEESIIEKYKPVWNDLK